MRLTRGTILALAATAAFAGCGSDEEGEPIPQASVAEIEAQLDNIEDQIAEGSVGACNDVKKPGNTFETLVSAVDNVPESVDPDVRDALDESISRLGDLVDEECTSREAETETVPEETETVPVETVPEEVPTETVETVPPEEEDQDDGEVIPPGQEEPGSQGQGQGGGSEPGGGGTGGGGLPAPGEGE
jgi:hypothetical protein